jgi:SAM-dependent methyltransferase
MEIKDVQSTFYDEAYSEIISSGAVGRLQKRIHKQIERDLMQSDYDDILEFGAGNLEHLSFSDLSYNTYFASDIRYTRTEIGLLKEANPGLDFTRVRLGLVNAENPGNFDTKFDLIIATCVLIHLRNPESALRRWKELVRAGGELAIYVPAEPGLFLRIGRKLLIQRKHKRHGISNSDLLYAREHVSSFYVLSTLIKEVFSDSKIRVRYWPFGLFRSWNLNAAAVFTIKIPC